MSALDSDTSDIDQQTQDRSKVEDYEVFLHGFFYFFLLQDPFIRNYLDIKYDPTKKMQEEIISDLNFFQENYMLQWVQIMVKMEIFQSSA